jgi:murein L,D-transpeptidase YafK
MIHGKCASVGCLAMSDERIQEIWIAATALRYAGGVVHLHIFPSRDMAGLVARSEGQEHHAFWANLKEGFDGFERRKTLPTVRVDRDGRYRFY